ncbi:MliC family protein [Cupriavidus sp. IDO]|uniref:MliC family protein n=1 Tax=Cupriavidus sp. IDO TaxID=1539142 RepID=UPI000579936A|nr:MliC family protein [Cupriavidus sp. IDO]KWR92092.1 hypothetical protein RM96_00935 [Cupriavidus sp. IDO]
MNRQPAFRNACGLALIATLGIGTAAQAARNPGIDDVRFQNIRTVRYQCEGDMTLAVRYFNSPDNQIAIFRLEGKSVLAVNVISGSGARYVGGRYEWWTKGEDGTLRELMKGENEPPVRAGCHAAR